MSKLFTMYVGTEFDKEHKPISKPECDLAIALLKQELASRFGGYSVGEVHGGYMHQEFDSYSEHVAEELALRIEVTASDAQIADIKECAAMFRDLFRQESVLLNCTTIDSNFI